MIINIDNCDFNNDYFHFTNKTNINSILNEGLKPKIGVASKLVGDRANVSVSKGGKGIMGIINSFIYKFYMGLRIIDIPQEYRHYFLEIDDFNSKDSISKDIACRAMIRKLKEEVYLRIILDDEKLKQAKVGGLTGYDVNLPIEIDKSCIEIITNEENRILSAYEVAKYVYEKAKDKEIFRKMHEDFFYMHEMKECN